MVNTKITPTIEIIIEHWDYECFDGSYGDDGVIVRFDGKKVYYGDGKNTETIISCVLDYVGGIEYKITDEYHTGRRDQNQ